jgi:hypothetical protein
MQGIFQAVRHIALIALFLRAMVPGGWMPDAHGLTVCSATLGVIHHDGGPATPSPDGHHEECPFAAAPHLASAPDVPQLTLPAFHAFAAAADRSYAAAIVARFAPQSPRAPPLNT